MVVDCFSTKAIRWLTVGIGIGLALVLIGCSRKPTPPQLTPSPPAPTAPVDTSPEADAAAAQASVLSYLRALYAQDYKGAYALLSEASQELHTQAEFAEEAAAGQVMYDLESAEVLEASAKSAKIVVDLQAEEEPGKKAFSVEKEAGEWKVVYLAGGPYFPYPK